MKVKLIYWSKFQSGANHSFELIQVITTFPNREAVVNVTLVLSHSLVLVSNR
jgi:hypothetical protein